MAWRGGAVLAPCVGRYANGAPSRIETARRVARVACVVLSVVPRKVRILRVAEYQVARARERLRIFARRAVR